MPTETPMASSIARRRRWPIVRPSVTTAEIGAKNGCEWPTTSVATSQASEAATAECRIGRAPATMRCRRVAQARARRLGCLLEQLVAPGAVDHLRYQRGDTFGGGRSAAFATSTVGSSRRR